MEVKIRDSQDEIIEHLKECSEKATKLVEDAKQTAKDDKGKIKPALVPTQIIRDIAVVREYGCEKYHSPDNWKKVEKERYENALLRHTLAWMDDKQSKDKESGIEHYKHMACNLAFLCEMYKDTPKKPDTSGTINTEHVNVIPRCIEISNEILEEPCLRCKYLKGQLIASTRESFYHCRLGDGLLKIKDVNNAARTSCNCFEEAANNV